MSEEEIRSSEEAAEQVAQDMTSSAEEYVAFTPSDAKDLANVTAVMLHDEHVDSYEKALDSWAQFVKFQADAVRLAAAAFAQVDEAQAATAGAVGAVDAPNDAEMRLP